MSLSPLQQTPDDATTTCHRQLQMRVIVRADRRACLQLAVAGPNGRQRSVGVLPLRRALCFPCGTVAHPGVDCEANRARASQQAERNLLSLAKQRRWRQCPQCRCEHCMSEAFSNPYSDSADCRKFAGRSTLLQSRVDDRSVWGFNRRSASGSKRQLSPQRQPCGAMKAAEH